MSSQVVGDGKAVHRDQHRMQAVVRFREIGREQKSHFVAWFEPEHHIVEAGRAVLRQPLRRHAVVDPDA